MPTGAFVDYWALLARLSDVHRARSRGIDEVLQVRRARLAALVRHARERSVFYRERFADLKDDAAPLDALPVVTKRELMDRFDDAVTDINVTRERVAAFVADRDRIGQPFLGRYTIWKSSGTRGEPASFIQDPQAMLTYQALVGVQLQTARLASPYGLGLMRRSGRAALLAASDEHFASIAYWRRAAQASPWSWTCDLSIMEPTPKWVAALNEFDPAFVASYPSVFKVLGDEKRAGRLTAAPVILWSGGEHLSAPLRAELEHTFGCPVIDEYGASECLSIAFGCTAGWLHVNADWVILEPVDREYRPVPPGERSDTVLLTNLANHVQPIIRYDLGDRVTRLDGPCACGNPLPAIRIEGRTDDLVTLARRDGGAATLLPLALTTAIEEEAGVHQFQIIQRGPRTLALRLSAHERSFAPKASEALRRYLDRQGVEGIEIAISGEPPSFDARSGKLRQVMADT